MLVVGDEVDKLNVVTVGLAVGLVAVEWYYYNNIIEIHYYFVSLSRVTIRRRREGDEDEDEDEDED